MPLLSICMWTGKVRRVISYANHGCHNDEHLTDTRREPSSTKQAITLVPQSTEAMGPPMEPWTWDDNAP